MNDLDIISEPSLNAVSNTLQDIIKHNPEHKEMINVIKQSLPAITKSTQVFFKTQSQFMDNMLTVSHPTPLRNIRQILAEMNRTKEALTEAHFNILKKETKIKLKKRDLEQEKDELKRDLIQIKIAELYSNLESMNGYVSGAIRRLTNYTEQYNSIVEKYSLHEFNEVDFENEEEKYHIMKAFDQGICAARSHNGVIDEGNMIYLTQIGINGATAQRYVDLYLNEERTLLKEGKAPTNEMLLLFLNQMADKFKGCSKQFAEYKGMKGTMTEIAALKLVKGE